MRSLTRTADPENLGRYLRAIYAYPIFRPTKSSLCREPGAIRRTRLRRTGLSRPICAWLQRSPWDIGVTACR